MIKGFPKKKCIICKRIFTTYRDGSHGQGRHGIGKRPFRSVTCSKKCSSVYNSYSYKTMLKKKLERALKRLEAKLASKRKDAVGGKR